MAKINWDHPDASGGPTIKYGVDFDAMTEDEALAVLGLNDATGPKLKAAVAAAVPDAATQAQINGITAVAVAAAIKLVETGQSALPILAAFA